MKKLYQIIKLYWTMLPLTVVIGCHQEPVVPQSAIPLTCRITQLVTVNEGIRDTTTYRYNAFGLIEKSAYRQWSNGQITLRNDQSFTYAGDYYLLSQTDQTATRTANGNLTQENKGYLYTYQDGRIQQVAILDNASNAKLGFRDYTYEGDKLKTYAESDGNKSLIRRYTFDGTGKLTGYEEPSSVVSYTVSGGKITQRVLPNGNVTGYEYDTEGQLIKQTITANSERVVNIYGYDSKPHWNKTQLRQRGIPSPDLGDHLPVHNLLTYTTQRYQGNALTSEQKLTYNHAYNKVGYSTGYGRNDGSRQINYYSNCP